MQSDDVVAAQEMIKGIYDDGEAVINGRTYKFHTMVHKQRRKVFAFYTGVSESVNAQDFSFLDSERFDAVESVIMGAVSYDGSILAKAGDKHWDEYPEDYLPFISTALAVISYPFIRGGGTA